MTPTPAWYEADADDSDRNVTDDITASAPQEPRGAILPAAGVARGFSDADLLRKRTAALGRVAAENERLRAIVRDVEALCACESTGCPCGGDRASVPTRDLRAVLARSQAQQAPAEQGES